MYQLAATTRRQARTLRLGHLTTVLLLAVAAAGLPGCDKTDPTATDLTTSSEGARASAAASTADGDGSAALAAGDVTALGTIPLPINQSRATAGVLFSLTQTGNNGPNGLFQINNTANLKDALRGLTNGFGNAVHGIATGNGRAGLFETVNTNSKANTLELLQLGQGFALKATTRGSEVASFLVDNSISGATAVLAETKGNGDAVKGRSASGVGVTGESNLGLGGAFINNAGNPALTAINRGTGFAATFEAFNGKGVLISTGGGAGLQVVGGSKNAVVATPSGSKALYTEESTEVWFTDYGFGRLANGRVRVRLDPSFAQTINPEEPYHVFVQPYGRAELYVAERTPLGFTVALKDGDPTAEFSYRIVAKRLGFEGKRLEAAPWADHLSARD